MLYILNINAERVTGMGLDGDQYRMIVESAPNMIWRAGTDTLCDYFNATWLSFTGKTLIQEVGNGWTEGVHPEDFDRCVRTYLEAFHKREIFEMIYRLKRFDGQWRWIHDRGVPFYNDRGDFAGYIGSCLDVNEQVMGETWKTMAQKDSLTGIWNRQHFEKEAKKAFSEAMRSKNDLCAVMIDVDDFKAFNDRWGHAFGDKVLSAFAGHLKDNIREGDLLGRYGGDEFILFLPNTVLSDALQILTRIEDKPMPPVESDVGTPVSLFFSFGVSQAEETDTYESFVIRADEAMYAVKKQKKQNHEECGI